MFEYIVTPELVTSKWTKFLRTLRIKKRRIEFTIAMPQYFDVGTLLNSSDGQQILITKILWKS
jgi:hypothetical protein